MDPLQNLRDLLADLERQGALGSLAQLVLVVVLTVVGLTLVQRAVNAVVGRLLDREATEGTAQDLSAIEIQKRRDTLRELLGGSLRVLVLVIGSLMALQSIRIDVGPAIAGLGIAGIAVGLGAQSLVKDYLAGAFILVE